MFVARPSLLRAVGTAPAFRATGLAPRVARTALALRRSVHTDSLTPLQEIQRLNAQRSNRPCSPELAIYQPQLTWYLSGLHRVTGVAVAGLFYVGALAFALHPWFPAMDSTHAIEFIHSLPGWLKTTVKLAIAAPATFHSFNGIRHLMWDVGKGLTIKGVYKSGYAVLAATAVSTIYLAFFV
ncbi:cytochrome b560 subunit of succinate dehydrogenase [Cutaneotrichosporon oleaginosum]|uniref:Cytochrome b560 subunit of succinate dehydrogenase n=1 Tax=Cutaneotrichosporon oleaginosum TaxID=879819 RepID=A0A0J0XBT5_9TREE|nr:cytochrome b560 subunit of succinate dehydrogenase [Cutaneotrichosporon oleaginosum]KLT38531.1 cytochrome b560 subunit of succinate dehydrogenase [Cutaneotrichosporon oleaginosum]TXT14690.1 hypothetical protein COLE_00883 [Cutaneotrichosporon oleaginosum]